MQSKFLALSLVSALLLGGCNKAEEAAPAVEKMRSEEANIPGRVADQVSLSNGGVAEAAAPSLTPATDRMFVRSAEMSFRTRSVETTTRAIKELTARSGGYVGLEEMQSSVGSTRERPLGRDSLVRFSEVEVSNRMTLRVPNEQLDTILERVAGMAAFVRHRTLRAQDVAKELNRAGREQKRMEAAGKRLQELARTPGKVKDLAQVDEQALAREDRAMAAAARAEDLLAEVQLSTVELAFEQHDVTVLDTLPRSLVETWREPFWGRFGRAFTEGWDGAVEFVLWFASRWILLVFGAIGAYVWMRRRKNRLQS